MTIGSGIGIVGIWAAAAVMIFFNPGEIGMIGIFAILGTYFIAEKV